MCVLYKEPGAQHGPGSADQDCEAEFGKLGG